MTPTQPRFLLVAAAALLVWLPVSASAAPVTFTFSGTVSFVNPLLAGTFSIGNVLTGSLTFDSELVDSNANPNIGRYAPLSSLVFTVGSYTATFVDGSGFVNVTNGPPGSDQLLFRGDVMGPTVNNFKPFNLQLGLTDATGNALSSDALPLAFDTNQFTLNQFFFTFTNRANPYDSTSPGTNFTGLQGTFSGSASVRAVPEPATLTLLGGALASIALRIHRKRRAA